MQILLNKSYCGYGIGFALRGNFLLSDSCGLGKKEWYLELIIVLPRMLIVDKKLLILNFKS